MLAVGKAAGPEKELCDRYRERAAGLGRQVGVSAVDVLEISDKTGPRRAAEEGAALLAKVPKGRLIALDERGKTLTSERFAGLVQRWMDDGVAAASFAIGGADGHPPAVRDASHDVISLSPMTLPHALARVMVLEQIYRAVTLCAGHPYHRS